MIKFGITEVREKFEEIDHRYLAIPASYYVVSKLIESFVSDKIYNINETGSFMNRIKTYNILYNDIIITMRCGRYEELDVTDIDESFKVAVEIIIESGSDEIDNEIKQILIEMFDEMCIKDIKQGGYDLLQSYDKPHHFGMNILELYSTYEHDDVSVYETS